MRTVLRLTGLRGRPAVCECHAAGPGKPAASPKGMPGARAACAMLLDSRAQTATSEQVEKLP